MSSRLTRDFAFSGSASSLPAVQILAIDLPWTFMLASASRRSVWNCLLASPSETTSLASSRRCASVKLMVEANAAHWLNNSVVNKTEWILHILLQRTRVRAYFRKLPFNFWKSPDYYYIRLWNHRGDQFALSSPLSVDVPSANGFASHGLIF